MHFDTMHLSRCVQSELELIPALSGKLIKAIRRPSLHSEGKGAPGSGEGRSTGHPPLGVRWELSFGAYIQGRLK